MVIENFEGDNPFIFAVAKEKTDRKTKSKFVPERNEVDFKPTHNSENEWKRKELHDQIKSTVSSLLDKPLRLSQELFYVLHTKIPPSDPNIGIILQRLDADIVNYLDAERQAFIVKGSEKKLSSYANKEKLPKLFLENIEIFRPLLEEDQISIKSKKELEKNEKMVIISLMPNLDSDTLEKYSAMTKKFLVDLKHEFYELEHEGLFLSKISLSEIKDLLKKSIFVHFVESAPKGIFTSLKSTSKKNPKAITSGIEPLTKLQENPTVVVLDSGVNKIPSLKSHIIVQDSYEYDDNNDVSGDNGHGTPVSSLLVLGNKLDSPKVRIISYKIFENADDEQSFPGMMNGIIKYHNQSRLFLSSVNFGDLNPKLEAKLDRLIQKQNICFVSSVGNILPEDIEKELQSLKYPKYISKYNVQPPSNLISVIGVGSIAKKYVNDGDIESIARINELAPYTRCKSDNVFLFDCLKPEILDHGANLNIENSRVNFDNVGIDSFDREGNVKQFFGTSFSAPLFMRKISYIESFYGSMIRNSETFKAIAFISCLPINSECGGNGVARKILGCDNDHTLYFSEGEIKIRGKNTTEFYEKPYAEISIKVPFSVNKIDLCLVHTDDFQLTNIPYLNTNLKVDVWKSASGSKVPPDNLDGLEKITNIKHLTYSFKQRSMEGRWTFKIYPQLNSKMPSKYRDNLIVRFGVAFLLSRKSSLKKKSISMNKEINMM